MRAPDILPSTLLLLKLQLFFAAPAHPPFIKGLGYARLSMTNTMMAFVLLPVTFLVASQWGVIGMCVAWLAAYPPYFALTVLRASRVTPLTLGAVVRAMAPPALAAAAMYGTVAGASLLVPSGTNQIVVLVGLIALGAVVYGAFTLAFNRETYREAGGLMLPPRWRARLGC